MKFPEIKIRAALRAGIIKPVLCAVIMLAAILPTAGCSSVTDTVTETTLVKSSVQKTSSAPASETTQAITLQILQKKGLLMVLHLTTIGALLSLLSTVQPPHGSSASAMAARAAALRSAASYG